MRVFTGTFTKRNGEQRQMSFVRLEDLPEQFLDTQLTGNGSGPKLTEGQEVVWDLDQHGFRVFNWSSAVGDVADSTLPDSTIVDE